MEAQLQTLVMTYPSSKSKHLTAIMGTATGLQKMAADIFVVELRQTEKNQHK